MADLSIFEKYPDSWRIDHPDFGDVSKTTFAKGIITEIKMIPPVLDVLGVAPPPVFEPLAKVDILGEITDYLPLFYHPKKQYWDTNAYEATEFNQEQGYFENAWMSFRGGDEVVVMFKENTPIAIIGFADGNPRIGEALIGVDTPAYSSGGVDYPAAFNYLIAFDLTQDVINGLNNTMEGPDGLSLGLVEVEEINDTIIPAGIISDDYGSYAYSVWSEWSDPPQWLTETDQIYLLEYYYIVGPAIFLLQSLSWGGLNTKANYNPIGSMGRGYVGSFTQAKYNALRGGGASAASAYAKYLGYGDVIPPNISWGAAMPSGMEILWNYISGVPGPHPLALPSFRARPHNPTG